MGVGSFMRLLNRPTKVTVIIVTDKALPYVDNVPTFTVQGFLWFH